VDSLHNVAVIVGLIAFGAEHKLAVARLCSELAQRIGHEPTERNYAVSGLALGRSDLAEAVGALLDGERAGILSQRDIYPRQAANLATARAAKGQHHQQGACLDVKCRGDDASDFGHRGKVAASLEFLFASFVRSDPSRRGRVERRMATPDSIAYQHFEAAEPLARHRP